MFVSKILAPRYRIAISWLHYICSHRIAMDILVAVAMCNCIDSGKYWLWHWHWHKRRKKNHINNYSPILIRCCENVISAPCCFVPHFDSATKSSSHIAISSQFFFSHRYKSRLHALKSKTEQNYRASRFFSFSTYRDIAMQELYGWFASTANQLKFVNNFPIRRIQILRKAAHTKKEWERTKDKQMRTKQIKRICGKIIRELWKICVHFKKAAQFTLGKRYIRYKTRTILNIGLNSTEYEFKKKT